MSRPPRAPQRRPDPEAGFSLIEVVFALTILAVGLMAVAGLVPYSSNKMAASRSLTNASAAGEARLEELKEAGYASANLSAGSHSDTSGRYARTWVVHDNVPVSGSKRVDMTVSWTAPGGDKSITMSTYITR